MILFFHVTRDMISFELELYKYNNQLSFELTNEDSKQERVLESYLELAGLYNWDIINCIDKDKEKTIDEIHEEIMELLETKGIK